jgi:hypothetical protein
MMATENRPAPSQITTMGAMARMGMVWEATMYGRRPRSSSRECASAIPRAKPVEAPRTNPRAASRAVNSAAWRRTVTRGGPFLREGWNSWPRISWMCGMDRSFTGNGQVSAVACPMAR